MKGRTSILSGLILGMSISAFMQTFISATGAEIAASLGAAQLYPWIFGAYILASTAAMPIFGKAGETVSLPGLYALGAFLFGSGSLLGAFAPTMPALIIGRAISGFGAGAIIPAAYALVGKSFNEKELKKIFAIMGSAQIVSNILGPILGAILTVALWRVSFAITVLFAGAAAVLVLSGSLKKATTAIQISGKKGITPVDWPGALLLCISLFGFGLSFHFFQGSRISAGIGMLCGAAAAGAAAYFWENHHADPVLPLDTLRSSGMGSLMISALTIGAVSSASLAFVPLVVQNAISGWGRSAIIIPMMASASVGTIVSSLGSKKAVRIVGTIAWAGSMLSFFLLAAVEIFPIEHIAGLVVMPAGFGMGYLWPALLGRSQSGVASEKLSSLGGVIQLSRNMGGSAAISILGVLYSGELGQNAGIGRIFSSLAILSILGSFSWLRAKRSE